MVILMGFESGFDVLVPLAIYMSFICNLIGMKMLKLIYKKVWRCNCLKNWKDFIPPSFLTIFLTAQLD